MAYLIDNLEQLRKATTGQIMTLKVMVKGVGIVSEKDIEFLPGDGWHVYNLIDDSYLAGLSDDDLHQLTNIPLAIQYQRLFIL